MQQKRNVLPLPGAHQQMIHTSFQKVCFLTTTCLKFTFQFEPIQRTTHVSILASNNFGITQSTEEFKTNIVGPSSGGGLNASSTNEMTSFTLESFIEEDESADFTSVGFQELDVFLLLRNNNTVSKL